MFLFLSLSFVIAEPIPDFGKIVLDEINDLTLEQRSNLLPQGIQILENKEILEVKIIGKEATFSSLSFLDNLDFSKRTISPVVIVNKSSEKAIEANFKIGNLSGAYFLGNNTVYTPPKSHLLFKDNETTLTLYNSALEKLPISSGFTKMVIQGENVKISDDLELINGKIFVKENGYLLDQGTVNYKKNKFGAEHMTKILIANKPLENYKGSYIFQDKDKLIVQSFPLSGVYLDILEGHDIFKTDSKDNLRVFLVGGDSMVVEKRESKGLIPYISHKSTKKGRTRIENDRISFDLNRGKNDIILSPPPYRHKDYASKYQSVAMEIESDMSSLQDQKLRINSYRQFTLMSKDNKDLVTFNKYELPISSSIKDNQLQTINQLREKYPNMDFEVMKKISKGSNEKIYPNEFNEKTMPPYLVYLTDNFLEQNPNALNYVDKIEYGNYDNAGAEDYTISVGELLMDFSVSGGVRNQNPLNIFRHESEHILDHKIKDAEIEKLRTLNDPEINEFLDKKKNLKQELVLLKKTKENLHVWSKEYEDQISLVENKKREIVKNDQNLFQNYLEKYPDKPLMQQIYNKIALEKKQELYQGTKSQTLFKKFGEDTKKRIFNEAWKLAKQEKLSLGDFSTEEDNFKEAHLKLKEFYKSKEDKRSLLKLSRLKNRFNYAEKFKDFSQFASQEDFESALANFSRISTKQENLAIDELVRESIGLPNYYALRNYDPSDNSVASARFSELSSTFREGNFNDLDSEKMIQIEFDNGKISVEEYKFYLKFTGKEPCQKPDCCDKKCLISKFLCEGAC